MSDKQTSMDSRERAAHIACAVVLAIVVLGAAGALIAYFTMDTQTMAGHQEKVATKKPSAPAPKATPKPVVKGPQKTATNQTSTGSNAFRQGTGMSQLVTSQQVPQGITRVSQPTSYNDQFDQYRNDYAQAMTQNPYVNQRIEDPILHGSYVQGANRGDLADQYTDQALFAKYASQWRNSSNGTPLRYGQSDAYQQFMSGTDSQYHTYGVRAQ